MQWLAQQLTVDDLDGYDQEDDPPPGFPAKSPGHAAFIDPRDWIDYMPRAYAKSMPPVGLIIPGLWNPRNDEWDRYLIDEKKLATRDEYRHLLCYGVFTASAHAALTDTVATLRAENATARDTADANDLLDSAIRTIVTNGDGLLNALNDKRLEVSLHQAAKAQAAAQFKGSGSGGRGGGSGGNSCIKDMQDATPAQLTFLEGELARFVESGAGELGTCRRWVSRLFLVPKPGVNHWRCIIDLRVLNSYCVRKRLKM
eukprot:jgi/Tetstr1/437968/TSEL_026598.t1